MHTLDLIQGKKELAILCVGAHADDIEIGCGGTILRLLEECSNSTAHWIVLSHSSNQQRESEARRGAEAFLGSAKNKEIVIKNFRDSFFPYMGAQVKEYFEELKGHVKPDVIFTHYRNDLHQDHRLVSELTWNTFRDHLILEYEVPKYDGDLGAPNLFVPLSEKLCRRKIDYLTEHFASQKGKFWFTPDVFEALLRLRGLECNSFSKFAEAFYSHKLVF
jgi:LmbE family N-acetylglucosaminyl deacetylase